MMMGRIKTHIDNERGLTLIEILISVVIILLFVMVVTQFMGVSITDIFRQGERTNALALAQNKMEEIRANAEDVGAINDLYDSDELKGLDGYVISEEELFSNPTELPVTRFYMESVDISQSEGTVAGTKITVISFYHGGKYYVKQIYYISKIEE